MKYSALLIVFVCLLLQHCGQDIVTGGGGSDIEVYGYAYGPDRTPLAGARVRIRDEEYVAKPPAGAKNGRVSGDGVTAGDGHFSLKDLAPGSYRLEVYDAGTKTAVVKDLTVDEHYDGPIDSLVLQPWATVTGTVTTGESPAGRYVQVYGLERLVPVDSSGHFTISDLPAGTLRLRVVSKDTAVATVEVADSIVTTPGGSVTAPLIGWSRASRLYLNTSGSGAGVTENVYDFPLLVRLGSSDIDFSLCQDSGQDMRFSKSDGTELSHEIEHWDPVGQRAAIWVRVDTMYGNNDAQYLVMRWGNPDADTRSSGAAVFDTALGFAGVWHMGRGDQGRFIESSAFDNSGAGTATATNAGLIGDALELTGEGQSIDCGNHTSLQASDTMTVSAWIALANDTADRYMRVLSKKTGLFDSNGYELECNALLSSRTGADRSTVTFLGIDTSWARGYTTLTPSWHQITVTVAGDSSRVYCDGQDITTRTNRPYGGLLAGDAPLLIGSAAYGEQFYGRIDEVRIMKKRIGAAYVRLCFANQKADQTLIEIQTIER